MSEPEPSQIVTITEMKKDIDSNKDDIQENKDSIKECVTDTQSLRDIVIKTETYQKSTHDDVKSIRDDMKTISQNFTMPSSSQPAPVPPTPIIQDGKTDWGEWLMKNIFLIIAGLMGSVVTGVVVYLLTKALSN